MSEYLFTIIFYDIKTLVMLILETRDSECFRFADDKMIHLIERSSMLIVESFVYHFTKQTSLSCLIQSILAGIINTVRKHIT